MGVRGALASKAETAAASADCLDGVAASSRKSSARARSMLLGASSGRRDALRTSPSGVGFLGHVEDVVRVGRFNREFEAIRVRQHEAEHVLDRQAPHLGEVEASQLASRALGEGGQSGRVGSVHGGSRVLKRLARQRAKLEAASKRTWLWPMRDAIVSRGLSPSTGTALVVLGMAAAAAIAWRRGH